MRSIPRRLVSCISFLNVIASKWCSQSFFVAPSAKRPPQSSSSSCIERLRQAVHDQQSLTNNANEVCPPMTTALLKISYDGGRFKGFSAANDEQTSTGSLRSIQGTIQDCLSRLNGNLPVVVEGCSRTDKGVHAYGLVAQFYCIDPLLFHETANETTMSSFSIPGKRQPHPWNKTDASYFKAIPGDLASIQYKLNRMLPKDVRIVNIAPLPDLGASTVFHPTLSCTCKTYEYTLSCGEVHDPTQWRSTWHIGNELLDLDAMRAACQEVFVGSHDFTAFRGAPRGKDDRMKHSKQNPICNIQSMTISEDTSRSWSENTKVYKVAVTGDRFLYKMVRFLVGAVVAIGHHKLSTEDLQHALTSKIRDGLPLFECAPAKGLVLADVAYDGNEIDWH
ncbi:hypothetical protein MPSEU_000865700 [Mayamaea pseudoterrestris]|nr:hypothetical protein MPSEU_000865700 [Mayamaea pseudoterrestris]